MLLIDIPSSGGVYKITCVPTGKFYIGSAKNLNKRIYEHLRTLRHGTHSNAKLQHAFNKYGFDAFAYEILEYILLPELLTAREQWWLDKTQAVKKGFNLTPTAGSNLGITVSLESRERMSQSHLGQVSPNRGKKAPPHVVAMLRAARLGKPGPNLGRKFGPEFGAKIGDSKRGKPSPTRGKPRKPHTPETCAKIAAAGMGRKPKPETIVKLQTSKLGNTVNAKDYIVTSPDGTEYTVHNLKAFCTEHNLTPQPLGAVARGVRKHHKGWIARYAGEEAPTYIGKGHRKMTLIITAPDGAEYVATGIEQFCKEHGLTPSALIGVAKGQYKAHKGWTARFPDAM